MKNRFAWLLVLPYVVTFIPCEHKTPKPDASGNISTIFITGMCGWAIRHNGELFRICEDKETCEDEAESINEAHVRREGRKNEVPANLGDKHMPASPHYFDYKSACGQDDCGCDPNDSK